MGLSKVWVFSSRKHYILVIDRFEWKRWVNALTDWFTDMVDIYIYNLFIYWSASSARHFLSNIFKKQARNLCFTPLLFCMTHNDLLTKWIFIKESACWSGIHYYDVACLTENGRSRSNSRHLSEILFLVKIKLYKERKSTF
jgi:hypothetical protein